MVRKVIDRSVPMQLIVCGLVLGLVAGSAIAATPCTGVQDGSATRTGQPVAFSDCTFDLNGIDDFYFAVSVFAGALNVVGEQFAVNFTPNAGTKVITGAANTSANYGAIDKGVGYTGDCPVVSGADPSGGLALVTNHVYCIIFDSTNPPDIWIRTTWNGTQYTNTTIAHGATLPVNLESFSIE